MAFEKKRVDDTTLPLLTPKLPRIKDRRGGGDSLVKLGLLALDVSTPATPVPLSVIPGPGSSSVCTPAQDSSFKTRRAGVAVRGSRAWMNFRNGMREIELE